MATQDFQIVQLLYQANLISKAAMGIMYYDTTMDASVPDAEPMDTSEYIFPMHHTCRGIAFYGRKWFQPGDAVLPDDVITPDGMRISVGDPILCVACGEHMFGDITSELTVEAP